MDSRGQEKDDEIKGEGNSLNYTFRMHDPRVGRFFTTDPLESRYPHLTPYQFSSNSPIGTGEIEGLEGGEEVRFNQYMKSQGGVQALAVKTEQEMGRKAAEAIFVRMPESTIDGVTYTATSLFQGFIGGISYGYGDEMYGNGYKTQVNIPSVGFSWKNGFSKDSKSATRGNLSFKDGMRLIDGVTTIFSIGELSYLKLAGAGNKIAARESLAKVWGLEMEYVNFEKAIYTDVIEDGTTLIQYRLKANTKGNYYAYPGTTPEEIGLRSEDIMETYEVIVKGNQKVIKSTHAKDLSPYYDLTGKPVKGGGLQIKSDNLKLETNSEFNPLDKK